MTSQWTGSENNIDIAEHNSWVPKKKTQEKLIATIKNKIYIVSIEKEL